MAGEKAVEKTLASRAWKSLRDSHFPTAATAAVARLHFKWRDNRGYGYILKWLDALAFPQFSDFGSFGSANKKSSTGTGFYALSGAPGKERNFLTEESP